MSTNTTSLPIYQGAPCDTLHLLPKAAEKSTEFISEHSCLVLVGLMEGFWSQPLEQLPLGQ